MATWIDCKDRLPPLPDTPYHVYLVWAVPVLDGATGTKVLLQFNRQGFWMPVEFMGNPMRVTHWSNVLEEMGSPEPRPFGPRGYTDA